VGAAPGFLFEKTTPERLNRYQPGIRIDRYKPAFRDEAPRSAQELQHPLIVFTASPAFTLNHFRIGAADGALRTTLGIIGHITNENPWYTCGISICRR
jgi:hypothetical protein